MLYIKEEQSLSYVTDDAGHRVGKQCWGSTWELMQQWS